MNFDIRWPRWTTSIVVAMALLLSVAIASAQQQPTATLHVTVVDQSNAIVVGATVKVTGTDAATKGVTPAAVQTSATGVAVIPSLVPGRYSIEAEFPGSRSG